MPFPEDVNGAARRKVRQSKTLESVGVGRVFVANEVSSTDARNAGWKPIGRLSPLTHEGHRGIQNLEPKSPSFRFGIQTRHAQPPAESRARQKTVAERLLLRTAPDRILQATETNIGKRAPKRKPHAQRIAVAALWCRAVGGAKTDRPPFDTRTLVQLAPAIQTELIRRETQRSAACVSSERHLD